jgi:prepilin-type N-terminal cleavage/methylation domain-containing protein
MRLRRGFSLVEMLVAITLTLAVFAITLPFVRAQSRALGENAGRLDAEQIARYAQRAIDRELRLAISDPGQPMIVYAGPMGIAFNANLLAADTTDPSALAVEAGAASTLTEAWRVANAATIPKTVRTYPTVNYTDASGALSRIETISYFLHPDTFPNRSDIYVLYRRVNARDSVQVVRNIHVPADSAFFSYQRMVNGVLTRIPAASLPLFWDTTAVNDIRAVGLRSAGFFRNRQTGTDVIRTVYWVTSLSNAGTAAGVDGCSGIPALPGNSDFDIDVDDNDDRPLRVHLQWDASADDEDDDFTATQYVIERKRSTDTLWTAVGSMPAMGENNYDWYDYPSRLNGTFQYGLRVLGCGGESSARKTWSSVTLP